MKRGGRTPRDGNNFRREREGELLSREERREKRESLPLSLPHARVREEEKEKERREGKERKEKRERKKGEEKEKKEEFLTETSVATEVPGKR